VDHVLIGFGIALLVENIPSRGFEKRVQKFSPQLGLIVRSLTVRGHVMLKAFYEFLDDLGSGYGKNFLPIGIPKDA